MWKGVIIEESLVDNSILDLVSVVKSKKTTLENEDERGFLTFHYIKLDDNKKELFIQRAMSVIKNKFYIHLCKDEIMIVIYKNKMFEFSSDELDKLNETRDYGLSIGILKEQMPFEELVKDAYS